MISPEIVRFQFTTLKVWSILIIRISRNHKRGRPHIVWTMKVSHNMTCKFRLIDKKYRLQLLLRKMINSVITCTSLCSRSMWQEFKRLRYLIKAISLPKATVLKAVKFSSLAPGHCRPKNKRLPKIQAIQQKSPCNLRRSRKWTAHTSSWKWSRTKRRI